MKFVIQPGDLVKRKFADGRPGDTLGLVLKYHFSNLSGEIYSVYWFKIKEIRKHHAAWLIKVS